MEEMELPQKRRVGRPNTAADTHTKSKTISVTETQKAVLMAFSKATGRSISQLVDEWIREAIDEGADV